ncbi:MAG: hypothetical protein AAFO58_08615 [Pseudomonadota bacterium]
MSASETNVSEEKQRRRHIGPLVGISVAVAFGLVMLLTIAGAGFNQDQVEGDAAVEPTVTLGVDQ